MELLTVEYEEWLKAQGLSLGSADEHLFDEDLTDNQRQWLRDFCERWERAWLKEAMAMPSAARRS